MPYALRKAPRKELYWVVNTKTGEKYSHDPIPKRRAEAQKRVLEEATGKGKHSELAKEVSKKTAATNEYMRTLPSYTEVKAKLDALPKSAFVPPKVAKERAKLMRELGMLEQRGARAMAEYNKAEPKVKDMYEGYGKDCGCGGGKNCITKTGGIKKSKMEGFEERGRVQKTTWSNDEDAFRNMRTMVEFLKRRGTLTDADKLEVGLQLVHVDRELTRLEGQDKVTNKEFNALYKFYEALVDKVRMLPVEEDAPRASPEFSPPGSPTSPRTFLPPPKGKGLTHSKTTTAVAPEPAPPAPIPFPPAPIRIPQYNPITNEDIHAGVEMMLSQARQYKGDKLHAFLSKEIEDAFQAYYKAADAGFPPTEKTSDRLEVAYSVLKGIHQTYDLTSIFPREDVDDFLEGLDAIRQARKDLRETVSRPFGIPSPRPSPEEVESARASRTPSPTKQIEEGQAKLRKQAESRKKKIERRRSEGIPDEDVVDISPTSKYYLPQAREGRGKLPYDKELNELILSMVKKGVKPAEAHKKAVAEMNKANQKEAKQEQKEAVQEAKEEVKEEKEEAHEKGLKEVKKEEAYLAKEYAKEFPNQKLTGGALKKHMKSWVVKQLKKMDCGCGCKGMKKLRELASSHSSSAARRKLTLKYGERLKNRVLKGGKLVDCPEGYRNDGLTCLEECKGDEEDQGLTCMKKCPSDYRDDGTACRKCPEGFTDTGLDCLENCRSGESDGGLFCKGPCPGGYRDDGTYCRRCPPGYEDTGLTCYKGPGGGQVIEKKSRYNPIRTVECGRHRGAFGEDWGPRWCSSGGDISYDPCPPGYADDGLLCRAPIIPAETVGQDAFPNTRPKGSTQQMVIWRAVRGKDVKGRVDVNGTFEEIKAGLQELLKSDGALAMLFDPEKNGVGAAFRKFGKDTEAAFASVGNELLKAFDPNQNGVKAAFEKLGDAIKDTIGNENWWKETMSDPDTYIFLLGMIASAAATVLSAGTLGPAAFIALNALGPATKMIGDAAQGRPIDGMDIAGLVMGLVPLPGAGAAAKAASDAIIKGAAFGTTAAKALPYVQRAVQVGKLVATGVEVAQMAGYLPSTCLTNCQSDPAAEDETAKEGPCAQPCMDWDMDKREGPAPPGCDCDAEAAKEGLDEKLESGETGGGDCVEKCAEAVLEDLPPPEGCDCDAEGEEGGEDEDIELGGDDDFDPADFGLEGDEEDEFLDLEDVDDAVLADAAEEVGLDDADLEVLDVDEEVEEAQEEAQEEEFEEELETGEELDADELNELEEAFEVEPEGEETTNAGLEGVLGAPNLTKCQIKFYNIYDIDADQFLELSHEEMAEIAESKGKTHEQAMDAAEKAMRSGGSRRRKTYSWNKWA
jgi:hypothetical protein